MLCSLPAGLLTDILITSATEPAQVTADLAKSNLSTRSMARLALLCKALAGPAHHASFAVIQPSERLSAQLDAYPEDARHIDTVVIHVHSSMSHVRFATLPPV